MDSSIIASPVIDAAGIERALEDFAREPHGGMVVLPGPVTSLNRTLIVALAKRFHLPSVFALDGPVKLGG